MPDTDDRDRLGPASATSGQSGIDEGFARVVEQVTRRLQLGEAVDDEAVAGEYPEWAGTILGLMPTLRELARLGRAVEEGGSVPPGDAGGPADFGDFRIVREVGRGGMGIVHEAIQVALGRRVALKLLPAISAIDPRAVRRFQLEAQVAGWLQHPRIVPVHDVGQVGGVFFYAMQFIEGGSLADLVRVLARPDAGPGPDAGIDALAEGLLSGRFPPPRGEASAVRPPDPAPGRSTHGRSYVRAVARLGIQAAEALEYAHEQGVVHRDIKPANLLLDRRGDLWVADFGMADVQGDAGLTATGDLPGTLRYMSPEQAMGRRALVDRRTDVYSLGATLYELLTLRPAVSGADRQEIYRRIAEEEPTPIRALNPAVPVDLATILAKAMAKEPRARYETAGQFADDLGRFLEGRPIAARPVGPLARSWRWCRRKPLLAGLAAGLTAALLAGLVGITWSWREAVRQKALILVAEKEARRQAAISEAINRFLLDRLLGQASPENNPDANRVTVLEVLDRAAAEVGTSFAGQPEVEASIRLAIGRVYHGLGEYGKSEAHLRRALEIARREPGGDGRLPIEAKSELGHALYHLERPGEAGPLLREAVRESRDRLGRGDRASILALGHLADLQTSLGQLAEAEANYRASLEDARSGPRPDEDTILTALNNLGLVLYKRGKYAEAEALGRQLVEDSRRVRGPKHPGTLSALNNLATLLEKRSQFAEAERLFREVTVLNREVLGPNHPGHFAAQFNLAHVLAALGRDDEAEALFRRNLDAQRGVLPPDHPTTLYTTSRLGALLRARGRLDEAERLLRPCLEAQRRALGPDDPSTLKTATRLDAVLKARAPAGGATSVAGPPDAPR